MNKNHKYLVVGTCFLLFTLFSEFVTINFTPRFATCEGTISEKIIYFNPDMYVFQFADGTKVNIWRDPISEDLKIGNYVKLSLMRLDNAYIISEVISIE